MLHPSIYIQDNYKRRTLSSTLRIPKPVFPALYKQQDLTPLNYPIQHTDAQHLTPTQNLTHFPRPH